MITENDIKLHIDYDGLMAYSWNDGPKGVKYAYKGIFTLMPLHCSKQEFIEMVNKNANNLLER